MSFQIPPAIDLFISELVSYQDPPKRVRVTGLIVTIDSSIIVLNDGENQITINHYLSDINKYAPKSFVRAILDVNRIDDVIVYKTIAIHLLNADDLKRYQQIIHLERRIPISD